MRSTRSAVNPGRSTLNGTVWVSTMNLRSQFSDKLVVGWRRRASSHVDPQPDELRSRFGHCNLSGLAQTIGNKAFWRAMGPINLSCPAADDWRPCVLLCTGRHQPVGSIPAEDDWPLLTALETVALGWVGWVDLGCGCIFLIHNMIR